METTPRILIIEDDTDINNLIRKILVKQNYHVTQSFSGTEACLRLELERFDLMILDLMLPGMNGENVLHKLRAEMNCDIPVLILSAKSSLADKVQLLTTGADDYMTKPFEPEELLARVFASLQRSARTAQNKSQDSCISYKKLQLFPASRKITVNGQELLFTPHEYDILSILIHEPDRVFSRETLYERVWSNGYYGEDNTVNVHVSNIRKKIGAAIPAQNT